MLVTMANPTNIQEISCSEMRLLLTTGIMLGYDSVPQLDLSSSHLCSLDNNDTKPICVLGICTWISSLTLVNDGVTYSARVQESQQNGVDRLGVLMKNLIKKIGTANGSSPAMFLVLTQEEADLLSDIGAVEKGTYHPGEMLQASLRECRARMVAGLPRDQEEFKNATIVEPPENLFETVIIDQIVLDQPPGGGSFAAIDYHPTA